ncbi:interleukin-23 receptor isoform X2 [Tachysurus vachellii]|uniref:interleukin-23 receptor isoform X2 n=1 Tax=Tachysurus vachellii TaxID=175792 RepID=UPI00296A8F5F|nr:interleukin-23 receptor isoform X2 [Tachysurus vachellii]
MGHSNQARFETVASSDEERQRYESREMEIITEALRLVFLLLLSCELRDCYSVTCTGKVTLDQDIIPIGSNLTVHCLSDTVQCGRIFTMTFNEKEILRKISCANVTAQVVVNEPQSLIYCFEIHEGKSHIVCGQDIIANPIPSRPEIKEIVFTKGSLSPTLYWHSSDNMENLKPRLRFRITHDHSGWVEGNVAQLHKGTLVLLEKLEPLTLYQFELKVCTASMKNNCSLWSERFSQSSPGKAPSTKLDVWRTIMRNEQSNTQNVTVMWKPLGKEDFKGVFHHYEIVYQEKGTTYILNCSTAVTQYTIQLPLEVTDLNFSAVTSAGSSPPASVRLICSGIPTPEIKSSHAAGGGINLTWDFSSRTSEKMLGFVVQWQCNPLKVQWKRIEKNYNSVYIQATQGDLCNISLYVERSDGVSCPSFKQIHTITNDIKTITNDLDKEIVPRIETLTMHSAAEKTRNGLVVGICLITAVPIIIVVNLLYLKCTRQRLRKVCVSMGPAWLSQNLPQLGNSNAIKLLKDERYGSDLCWQPVDSDPPLSPVEDYSPPSERKDSYPVVHREVTTEKTTVVKDWTVCPYKPQVTISQETEMVCEVSEMEEDEPLWGFFSSPIFSPFKHFPQTQGMHASLPSCLTVDGRPVSMDLNGFPFSTQTVVDGNLWTDGSLAEIVNSDQNQFQTQTVLPNDLVRCLREPCLF